MPTTSATIDASGSVQPSSACERGPSGHDQVGLELRESIAAMPIAAVSARDTNFSDQAP